MRGSAWAGIDEEHTAQPDSVLPFLSAGRVSTTSAAEWALVVSPSISGGSSSSSEGAAAASAGSTLGAAATCPEREGYQALHPEWCRKPVPLEMLIERMEVSK